MPRRTKKEALKTRRAIMESSLKLFCERGYSKTSLVDIAKSLGLSKGAVYWHFESKLDLFVTLTRDISEKIDTILKPVAEKVRTINDLKLFFVKYAETISKDEEISSFFNIVIYKIEWNEELTEVTSLINDEELISFCESLIKNWQKAEIIKTTIKADMLASILVSQFNGILYDYSSKQNFTDIVETSIDIFFEGLSI